MPLAADAKSALDLDDDFSAFSLFPSKQNETPYSRRCVCRLATNFTANSVNCRELTRLPGLRVITKVSPELFASRSETKTK